MSRLVCGVGVNDAGYAVCPRVNGKTVWCLYYRAWGSMLSRCYSKKFKNTRPTYIGCTVCDEWLTFSNFKAWMETQDWEGKALDKDLLVSGNKIYSPDTCTFVTRQVNSFLLDSGATRGEHPVGVYWDASKGKFRAMCCSLGRGQKSLGLYSDPESAHQAWREYKLKLAGELATLQTDKRVSEALLKLTFE